MTLTIDGKRLYAGQNEFYKYGRKAQEALMSALNPNAQGFYNIPTCTKYFAFGTSEGKYGDYAKWNGVFFSVNKGGYIYAKAGTEKGQAFVEMIEALLNEMCKTNEARLSAQNVTEEE